MQSSTYGDHSFRDTTQPATLATVKITLHFDYTSNSCSGLQFRVLRPKFVGPYLAETQAQTVSTCGMPINIDGYLFANYHVVTGENKIKAALADGLDYDVS